jgi:hypothetical protein
VKAGLVGGPYSNAHVVDRDDLQHGDTGTWYASRGESSDILSSLSILPQSYVLLVSPVSVGILN